MFSIVRRVLGKAAGQVRRAVLRTRRSWSLAQSPVRFIAALKPDVLLDIGANAGQFATQARAAGYHGRIVSFEPQPAAFAALAARAARDPAWECHRMALGDTEGELSLHVSGYSESSSLLPIGQLHVELMPKTAEVGTIPVPVARLDRLAGSLGLLGTRFALKFDVQGYELPALRGCGDLLPRALGAVVELNFAPLFDGQSNYYEVMHLLENAGLRFVGLANCNLHPDTHELLWADGLFARRRATGAAHD